MSLVSLLQAHAIPHFVHNAGFGSLFPGLQISLYNVRTIMVPATAAPAAVTADIGQPISWARTMTANTTSGRST